MGEYFNLITYRKISKAINGVIDLRHAGNGDSLKEFEKFWKDMPMCLFFRHC